MSELIVTSGHGMQEATAAILEVRPMLRSAASPRGAALDVRQTGDSTPSAGAHYQGLIN